MKKIVFHALQRSEDNRGLSYWVDGFILALISVNVLAVLLGTVQSAQTHWGRTLDRFGMCC